MKKKKVYPFVILIILVFNMIPAFASIENVVNEPSVALPRFTNIIIFYNDFCITDQGKSMLTSSIDAQNVDRIKINLYLQKYEDGQWINIKSWSSTQNGTFCGLGEVWYVKSGCQYRMVSYGYVYENGVMIESTSYFGKKVIY